MGQTKELEALKKLVGNWKVDIKFKMPDGKVFAGKGIYQVKPVCMGRGIYMMMKANISGLGEYEEHDLVGISEDGKVHVFSLTSTGAVHDHVGNWKDDKTLEVEWKGLSEGKETVEVNTVTFISPNEIHIKEVDTVEGKTVLIGDYILKK